MRLSITSPTRSLRVASSLFLLSLLAAALADAAPMLRRAAVGPMCDAQAAMVKTQRRLPKSFGGPLKAPKHRAVTVSTDATARLVRAPIVHRQGDGTLIQNDAPAARVDAGDQLVPSLRSLGVLSGAVDMRPSSRTFSPRSPRGPPVAA
jgi:hypothetical protein